MKRVVVEAVPRDGVAVLNADDPLVADMARHSSGSVIYFSMDPEHDRLKFQASRGRRAVTIEQGRNGEKIVLRQGRKSMDLVWTHLIPATFEGRARMNVQNALAATAACWAAGAHLHDIRQGLRTFTTSYYMAPGRLNMFELDGYRVVVDYAHNPPAVRALGEFVDRMTEPSAGGARPPVTGRRIGVIATAGDRRDEDIVELGQAAAAYFDEIVVREDENNRGRPRGNTAALIEQGIRSAEQSRVRDGDDHPRRARGNPPRPGRSRARATWWWCASTTPTRSGRSSSAGEHGAASETDGLRAVVGVIGAEDEVDLDL